ncbi:MAG: class I SAM-dependent methyltransferase, partial [bacterium]|nr:class I SAM-dependent methyltransferase [bacterium]
MDYKTETKKAYDKYAKVFDEKFEIYTTKYITGEIKKFLQTIPKGAKILDIGSGPGNHALRFQQKGFDVTCIDISKSMVEICKQKGLKALQMDFENLVFPKNSFDAVWAYTSFLHIPKSKFEDSLTQVLKVLKKDGIFFLGMKAGNMDGFRNQPKKYPGTKRWFALYIDTELRKFLKRDFIIEQFTKTHVGDGDLYLNYLLKKSQPQT